MQEKLESIKIDKTKQKLCHKCGTIKMKCDFYTCKTSKSQIVSVCKTCTKQKNAEAYKRKKERMKLLEKILADNENETQSEN